MRSLLKLPLILAVLSTVVATTVAYAARAQRPDAEPSYQGQRVASRDEMPAQPDASTITPGHRSLAVFRAARATADRIPPDVATKVRRGLAGESPDLSRLVLTHGSVRGWAVPAQEAVCLVLEGGSGGCTPNEQVQAQGTLGQMDCLPKLGGQTLLFGLLPDRAETARIVLEGERSVAVDQGRNAFSLSIEPNDLELVRALAWTTSDGRVEGRPVSLTAPSPCVEAATLGPVG